MRRAQDMGDEIDRLRAENERLRDDTRNIQRNTAVYRHEARAEVDKANRRAFEATKRADCMAEANRALLSAFEQNHHPAAPQGEDFLGQLRRVNSERLAAWCSETELPDGLFHATELGGEVGEVLNVVKKLHREAAGWRGTRATLIDLAEELGDVLICIDKLAAYYGIDLAQATAAKFNATSEKVGLPQRLAALAPAAIASGREGAE